MITVLLMVSCNGDVLPGKLDYIEDYSNVKASFIGDSITAGVNISHPYPEIVKALLGLKDAVNLGIGGSTVSNIPNKSFYPYVERIDSIDEDSDIVGIQIQLNDWTYHVPVGTPDDKTSTTFMGALNYLIKGIKQRCPEAYIFIIGPNNTQNGFMQTDYANAVKKIARFNEVDYLNLFEESASFDWRKHTSDGTHHMQEYITKVLGPRIANFIVNHYSP